MKSILLSLLIALMCLKTISWAETNKTPWNKLILNTSIPSSGNQFYVFADSIPQGCKFRDTLWVYYRWNQIVPAYCDSFYESQNRYSQGWVASYKTNQIYHQKAKYLMTDSNVLNSSNVFEQKRMPLHEIYKLEPIIKRHDEYNRYLEVIDAKKHLTDGYEDFVIMQTRNNVYAVFGFSYRFDEGKRIGRSIIFRHENGDFVLCNIRLSNRNELQYVPSYYFQLDLDENGIPEYIQENAWGTKLLTMSDDTLVTIRTVNQSYPEEERTFGRNDPEAFVLIGD